MSALEIFNDIIALYINDHVIIIIMIIIITIIDVTVSLILSLSLRIYQHACRCVVVCAVGLYDVLCPLPLSADRTDLAIITVTMTFTR